MLHNFIPFLKISRSGFQWALICDLFLNTVSGQKGDSATDLCRYSGNFVISHSKTSWWSYLIQIMVVKLKFGSVIFFQRHFRSCKALAIPWLETSSWNEIERRGWSHCVQLVKTYWLIYILTFFGDHLALRERNLTSNFALQLSELINHVSSVSMREKGVWIIAPIFLLFKTFSQNPHQHFVSFWSDLVIKSMRLYIELYRLYD